MNKIQKWTYKECTLEVGDMVECISEEFQPMIAKKNGGIGQITTMYSNDEGGIAVCFNGRNSNGESYPGDGSSTFFYDKFKVLSRHGKTIPKKTTLESVVDEAVKDLTG